MKTCREIAEITGCSKSTVARVIQQHRETGDIPTSYENCGGHNKKFDERDLRHIRQVAVRNPRSTAAEIQQELGPIGDTVSLSTMKRALREAGCKTRKAKCKPFLNETHKARRYRWARDHEHWTLEQWRRVVWSDETMIHVNDGAYKFVRVVDGYPLTSNHYKLTTKYPTKVMFWGCFGYQGTGRIHVVEGTLNSEVYVNEIVRCRVLPQLQDWFADGSGIFQQDNAPCHSSRLTTRFFEENRVTLLDWPPQSPDLNPIEMMWAIIKQRISKFDVRSKKEIIAAFIKVWHRDEEIVELCQKLIDGMPKRIQAVIEAKGGNTKYQYYSIIFVIGFVNTYVLLLVCFVIGGTKPKN